MDSDSMYSATCDYHFRYINIICEICDNEVALKNIIPHLMTHTGVSDCLICTKCERKFSSQNLFYEHMKMFHAVKISCQICSKCCHSKPLLYSHVKHVHGDIEMLKIDKPQLESHLDDLQKAFKAYKKEVRTSKYKRRRQRKEECKICGKLFRKDYLQSYHMKTHTHETPTTCDVCGKTFSSWLGMLNHKHVHRTPSDAQYQCHLCSKLFIRKASLDIHLQKHAGVVTHRCKECLQLYTGSHDKHVQEVHQKEGFTLDSIPTCEYCGKRFPDRYQLKMHLMMHTNETITCEICDKKLQPRALYQHVKKVHGEKRRKEMTQCRVCDKVVSKSYLSLHMAFHSDKKFQCEDCGKCFPLKGNLDTHRTSHTEHRPYSCDLCVKTFKLPHHMRAHRKTHEDA